MSVKTIHMTIQMIASLAGCRYTYILVGSTKSLTRHTRRSDTSLVTQGRHYLFFRLTTRNKTSTPGFGDLVPAVEEGFGILRRPRFGGCGEERCSCEEVNSDDGRRVGYVTWSALSRDG